MRDRWFLPAQPDLLGQLREQIDLTAAGMEQFAVWAEGDAEAADRVRAAEHAADDVKRKLRTALRDALVTPLDPEDVFALSRGTDWILNHAKDAVGESEVMACPPDEAVARMARRLHSAVLHLRAAFAALPGDEAIPAADAAVKDERNLEKEYRAAMGALVAVDDLRTVVSLAELYRRCSRMGETVVDVAERVVYAVVKES